MSVLLDKLDQIEACKTAIKETLSNKGATITDSTPLADYASVITNLVDSKNTEISTLTSNNASLSATNTAQSEALTAIKTAIINKGGNITDEDDYDDYADAIDGLSIGIDDEELQEYLTQAATSASNASTSEANAKTSETNAKTSETNAKTYADNASASATSAQGYADSMNDTLNDIENALVDVLGTEDTMLASILGE